MIQVSDAAINRAYAQPMVLPQSTTSPQVNKQDTPSSRTSDRVNISATGQTAASIGNAKISGSAGLPPLITDYNTFVRQAENGLRDLMNKLGISASTQVNVKVNNDGSITVTSNSSRNAELQAAVNGNPELRNALVGADNTAHLARAVHAIAAAQQAAEANPGKAEYYNNWAANTVQQIMAMPVEFDFAAGKLTGTFVSGGEKIGLNENLETPPA